MENVLLTPQLARTWLATNPWCLCEHDKLARYVAAIRAGEWEPGSVVTFQNGRLSDGTHRCRAVLIAGAAHPGVGVAARTSSHPARLTRPRLGEEKPPLNSGEVFAYVSDLP